MISLSRPVLANQDKNSLDDISIRQFGLGLILILCLAGVTYLSIAFFWGKFSRAEVFFAECSREMLLAGNFITPLYHRQPFFDKPIFVYWCIIGMFKLLGVNHFAARLPSVIASLITIGTVAISGSYLYRQDGRRTGLIAAGMLGSAFMYLSFSSLCMSDMFLVMFDLLSLIAVYAGIKAESKRSLYWWLAAVSMGFAFLAKGPVGVVLPVISSLIYLALTKNLRLIKINHVLLALVTIAIIASPWFYAAYLANGSSALIYFFVHENVQRFAGTAYDAHKPFSYMILGFFLGFAPWSILLPPAFLSFYRQMRKGEMLSGELFLWIWVFVAVGFFCVSRGQCDYYTLPAYPAAAILVARYVIGGLSKPRPYNSEVDLRSNAGAPNTADIHAIKNHVPWIIILLCAAYTVVTLVIGFLTTKFIMSGGQELGSDIAVSGIVLVAIPYTLLVLTGAMIALAIKQKYLATFAVATSGIFVLATLFASLILPQLNRLEPVDKFANLIKQGPDNLRVGTDKVLTSWNDEILFQSDKDPQRLDTLQQMSQFVAQGSPAILIAPIDKYNMLPANKSWHIIAAYKAVTHSLTPGYIIERKGKITNPMPIIVATNTR